MNIYKTIRKELTEGKKPSGSAYQIFALKKAMTDKKFNDAVIEFRGGKLSRKDLLGRFSRQYSHMISSVAGSGVDISMQEAIAPSPEDAKKSNDKKSPRLVYIMEEFNASDIVKVKPSYSLTEAFEMAAALCTRALKFHNPDIGTITYQVLADNKIQTLEGR